MDKKFIFGVDVGGTSVKNGLFTEDGTLLERWEIPTDTSNNGNNILPDIAKSLNEKIAQKGLCKEAFLGVGIGVPGPVDGNGVVHRCVNLGWGVFSIVHCMEQLIGLKVKASNDANVAALGEMWKGSGLGFNSLVLVTLGTGVGGGVIVDKKIVTGANGSAGEIGHIVVDINEVEFCTCGKSGCLEQYASATGMVNQAKKLVKDYPNTTLNTKHISAKAIVDEAKKGDALSLKVMEKMGQTLGLSLSHVAEVCDPQVIVIGGGVSKGGEFLLGFVKKYYKDYAFHAVEGVEFKIAELGNDAGIYGAARQII